MKITTLLLTTAGLALSMQAGADVSGTGPGATFTDNANASSSIVLGANEIITSVELTLFGLNHTWAGDLQATLTSPGGTVVSVFDGVGSAGNTGAGDSSDFGGNYSFSDAGGNLWGTAAALGSSEIIPSGDYFATDLNGVLVSLAAAFAGESTLGMWTLDIFDRAGGDTGDYDSWELRIISNPVPVPAAVWLFVSALMGLGALRRKG